MEKALHDFLEHRLLNLQKRQTICARTWMSLSPCPTAPKETQNEFPACSGEWIQTVSTNRDPGKGIKAFLPGTYLQAV